MSDSENLEIQSLYPAIPANHERKEEWILPREGEIKDNWSEPDAECGKTKYKIKCKDEYHCDHPVELVPWDCGRYECPVCGTRAIKKGAVGVREHVWNTLVEMKKAYAGINWSITSVVISPPSEINDLDFEQQHYQLRKAIKHLGTQDVAAIYHRWRYRDLETGEELEKVPWKEYQRNPNRFKRILSVHWHCFVIGKMVKSNKFFRQSRGWVYKNLGNNVARKDVYQIAYYALSHTALSTTKRRHATHYYGNFWRLSIVEERQEFIKDICPKCNNQRVKRCEYHSVWHEDMFGFEEPHSRPIVHRKYALRGIDYKDLDCGLDFKGYHAPVKEIDVVEL